MGGWRLEAVKMLAYLMFPIGAFVCFNHPVFYERSLRQTMEMVSKDINLDSLEQLEKLSFKEGIDKLGSTIDEIDNSRGGGIKVDAKRLV